jgi:uncharacterized protein YecE (DUF72 family)
MRYLHFCAHEQFGPDDLLRQAVEAERVGFEGIGCRGDRLPAPSLRPPRPGGNYSEAELDDWRRRIAGWRSRRPAFVYLNNDWRVTPPPTPAT